MREQLSYLPAAKESRRAALESARRIDEVCAKMRTRARASFSSALGEDDAPSPPRRADPTVATPAAPPSPARGADAADAADVDADRARDEKRGDPLAERVWGATTGAARDIRSLLKTSPGEHFFPPHATTEGVLATLRGPAVDAE